MENDQCPVHGNRMLKKERTISEKSFYDQKEEEENFVVHQRVKKFFKRPVTKYLPKG